MAFLTPFVCLRFAWREQHVCLYLPSRTVGGLVGDPNWEGFGWRVIDLLSYSCLPTTSHHSLYLWTFLCKCW